MLDVRRRENQNTHFFKFFFLNCAVYEIVWEVVVKLDRPHMTIWCMHIVC